MGKKLKDYFPMIRTKEEIKKYISDNTELLNKFNSWNEEQQERFLDICSGNRGAKLLYDAIFKEIFSPESHEGRLEELLTIILKRTVKIKMILPLEGRRIGIDDSIVSMDIVVQFDDGSIANVEVQKVGYLFSGERMECYSSDLLLRQYKKIRKEKGKRFTYKYIKTVYTIVFYEKSIKELRKCKDDYIHYGEVKFDTGMELHLPKRYILIALDNYKDIMENKTISNELEAWLMVLGEDNIERILEVIEAYPRFIDMYEDIYKLCLNTERMMEMFSEELAELDRNTARYMVDVMSEEIKGYRDELKNKDDMIANQRGEIEGYKGELKNKDDMLKNKDDMLKNKDDMLKNKDLEIEELQRKIELLTRATAK